MQTPPLLTLAHTLFVYLMKNPKTPTPLPLRTADIWFIDHRLPKLMIPIVIHFRLAAGHISGGRKGAYSDARDKQPCCS